MIIETFNLNFFILLAIIIFAIFIITYSLRNSSEKVKAIVLTGICVVNIVIFFIYKGFLSVDSDFLVISQMDRFNWFSELPLQLCNINMFLIPFGIITKNRSVLGFSFFIAPLGALMALIFPEAAFTGYSLALPRMWGFYFTHSVILISGILISSLGFYRPKYRDYGGITLTFIILSLSAHIINTVLRATVCPQANYFFTYGSDVSILNLFWKFIPVPFLYELPSLLILFAYMGIVSSFFYIADLLKSRKKELVNV